jgi:hypothetical protein
MTFDMMEVWKFEDAPAFLRRMHTGAQHPQWLVLIPAAIHGPDIDDVIRAQAWLDLHRYRTEGGDIVYAGSLQASRGDRGETHSGASPPIGFELSNLVRRP